MDNKKIAKILYEIADMLEIQDVEFKPRAYRRAAQSIESLQENITRYYNEDKLEDIPGVGRHIAEKLKELIKTGKLEYYENLKKELPIDFESLTRVEGIGPKKIKALYKNLKIKNLQDLKKAAEQGKVKNLEGFGEKTEREILESVEFAKKSESRILLGQALPEAEKIRHFLEQSKYAGKVEIAGSVRRMKETIGDLDILITSKYPGKLMDYFTKAKFIKKILGKGATKSSVILDSGLQIDVRVIDNESFGSAMQYFIGSKEHNIAVRKIAIKKGLKLSEYGVFKGSKKIAGATEESVYKALGLRWMDPEIRENSGEIEASLKNKLPKLINYNEIKGDLQMHTKYSDGSNTIMEMAEKAKKLNYKYIGITDHVGNLRIAGALSKKEIAKQHDEINNMNKRLSSFTILKGCEANIKDNGELDLDNETLKRFDFVIASIHSGLKNSREKATARILKAMENRYVNIIAHPTGRLINKRKGYELDFKKIFDKSNKTNTFLEINAFPDRLDLNSINIREAINHKCRLAINTDAHNIEHLDFMRYGIGTARKGWAEAKDIINTKSLNELLKAIKK